jgi:hypothetical protein
MHYMRCLIYWPSFDKLRLNSQHLCLIIYVQYSIADPRRVYCRQIDRARLEFWIGL